MKLRKLTYQNYRIFGKKIEIADLSDINFFIGPNSSGKSTILKSLDAFSRILTDNWDPTVDDYHNHDQKNLLIIGFEADLVQRDLIQIFPDQFEQSNDLTKRTIPIKLEVGYKNGVLHHRFLKFTNIVNEDHLAHFVEAENDDSYTQHTMGISGFIATIPNIKTKTSKSSDEYIEYLGHKLSDIKPFSQTIKDISNSLSTVLQHTFSYYSMNNDRKIVPTSNYGEENKISLNGDRFLNYHTTMASRQGSEAINYQTSITKMSDSKLKTVKSPPQDTQITLAIKEQGLPYDSNYDALGSGHQQTLLFSLLSNLKSALVCIQEPELHQHADLQKNILQLIKTTAKENDMQYFIETHSAIFVGFDECELTYLVTNYDRNAKIMRLEKKESDIIRQHMGISYGDSLDHEKILFIEGDSEEIALPIAAKKLGYDISSLKIWNIGGYKNVSHIGTFRQYLSSYSRMILVLLDNHEKDKIQQKLVSHGFGEDMISFWSRNFEDAFSNDAVYEMINEVCRMSGHEMSMSRKEIETMRITKNTKAAISIALKTPYVKRIGAKILVEKTDFTDDSIEFVRVVKEIFGAKLDMLKMHTSDHVKG